MPPSLSLQLFGPMQALVGGKPLPPMRSRKARWLLALLTLQNGQAVNREWVAGTLWPDATLPLALANLRPIVSELRRALGDQGERLRTLGRKMIALDLTDAEVDVIAFDAAITEGRFEAAVEAYRGALLEDCLEPWVIQARDFRDQACLEALDRLAQASEGLAQVAYRRRAVTIAPLRDAPRRGLMESLALAGDLNAALETYREFAQILRNESGSLPDAATTDVYHRLRTDAASRSRTSRPDPESATVTGYLPHPVSGLVGREDERADIASRLARSRLVTLTGFGGIGKTRLAREVAADMAPDSTDGVWFVSLDAVGEERLLATQVAAVLGITETTGRSFTDLIVERLRPQHALLVLDNCEHLIEASARLCDTLLRECGGLRILVTSREPLGITGEKIWNTTPLSVPDPHHLPPHAATRLRVVASYESVQLFLQRAQAIDEGFVLTADNAADVAVVCAQLEGIPLAIELAAARVKAMTIDQIRERLHDPLAFLTQVGRSSIPRQQTLRTTLDWSYGLLGEDARRLLRRVACFVGGWTLEAAEAVCGGEGIEPEGIASLLASLVDKSLVIFERDTSSHSGRYRLLEPVRQYATGLSAADSLLLRERFVAFFCARCDESEGELRGPKQGACLEWLRIEDGNIRQATRWAEETPELASYILRLAGAQAMAWFTSGRYREGARNLERALYLGPPEESPARAKALTYASAMAQGEGNFPRSLALQQEALKTYEALGDLSGIATAKRTIGDAYYGVGKRKTARKFFEESYRLHGELEQARGAAISAVLLGACLSAEGEVEAAAGWIGEGMAHFKRSQEHLGIAWAMSSLGNVYFDNELPHLARPIYEEELGIVLEHGVHRAIYTLDNLAKLSATQGNHQEAIDHIERALTIAAGVEDERSHTMLTTTRGEIAAERGDFPTAREYALQALRRLKGPDSPYETIYLFRILAAALIGLDRVREGVHLLGAAIGSKERLEIDLVRDERRRFEIEKEKGRARLPSEEFERAWSEGYALELGEAYEVALRRAQSLDLR